MSTALKYYRSILPLQKLNYQDKNIATVRRTSSQNATRANLMLLRSNIEDVSQGPKLINHQRCTSSRRYLYSAQLKLLCTSPISVAIRVSLGEVTTTLVSWGIVGGTRTKRTMDKTDQTKRTTFQDKTDHVSGQNGPRFRTKRPRLQVKMDHVLGQIGP